MSDSEETKPMQEQKLSSVTEASAPSEEVPEPLPETKSAEAAVLEKESPKEDSPELSLPKKVELKKHLPTEAGSAPAAVRPPAPAPVSVTMAPQKAMAVPVPQVGLEAEIDFILDRKCISLTDLSTLAEGEVIALSSPDFKVTLFLQDKAIGEGALVMVDQRPAIQITKVMNNG